jgi:hypothetical protein
MFQFAQAIVGFIIAGLYNTLAQVKHVAGFAVAYGIFLSLGEVGPGDNIGLLASKTCATGVRGQYVRVPAFISHFKSPDIFETLFPQIIASLFSPPWLYGLR